MKISFTVHIDPVRRSAASRDEILHIILSEGFTKLVNDQGLVEIYAFDLVVEYDADEDESPLTAHVWWDNFPQRDQSKK